MITADVVQTSAGVEAAFSLADYYPIFLFLAWSIVFLGALFSSQFFYLLGLKPKKDTAVKLMPYESGMDPVGSARHAIRRQVLFDRDSVSRLRCRIAVSVPMGGDRLFGWHGSASARTHSAASFSGKSLCSSLRWSSAMSTHGGREYSIGGSPSRFPGDETRLGSPTWREPTAFGRCRSRRPAAASS